MIDIRIRVYLDDVTTPFQELANGEKFNFDTTEVPDGRHTLRLETVEDGRVTGVREVPFVVRNGPGIAVAGIRAGDEVRGDLRLLVNASEGGIDARYDAHSMETHRGIPFWMGGVALVVILACAVYIATDPFRQRKYDALAEQVTSLSGRSLTPAAVSQQPASPAESAAGNRSPMEIDVGEGDYLPLIPIADKPANPERGAEIFAVRCTGCHGAMGEGTVQEKVTLGEKGVYPRIAGQNRKYIVRQLVSFADGWRDSPQMLPMALSLSDQDRLDVAAHIERLAPPYPPRDAVDTKMLVLGKSLSLFGRSKRGVSRCAACHGANGAGGGANFPWLAGQNPEYLVTQLYKWRKGARRNSWMHLMRPVAQGLTEVEITAVAAYYAHIRPTSDALEPPN